MLIASARQVRAIRKEFNEAVEDGAWGLAYRIIEANPGVFDYDDKRRVFIHQRKQRVRA